MTSFVLAVGGQGSESVLLTVSCFIHPHPAYLLESLQQNSQHVGKGVAEVSTCLGTL